MNKWAVGSGQWAGSFFNGALQRADEELPTAHCPLSTTEKQP